MTRLVLAWGDDLALLDEARATLAAVLGAGSPRRVRIDLGRKSAPRDLAALTPALASETLLGEGLLLELLLDDGDPQAPLLRAIDRIARSLAPSSGLFIRDERERRPTKRATSAPKLTELVVGLGGSVVRAMSPLTGELAPWLEAHAASRTIGLEPGVAQLISTRVGAEARELDIDRASMRAIALREIEKLASAAGDGPIRLGDADSLVGDRVGGSMFAFLDAVVMRDPVAIARHLDRASAEPGWKIVGDLHRRLRELMIIRSLLRSGHSVASASERSGINEWATRTLAKGADRWETRELGEALEGVLEIDRASAAGEGARRLALAIWTSEVTR
jgi:DNA polymerase III delta subunit